MNDPRDPCAVCEHPQRVHHHHYGAGLRPGGFGQCLKQGCPCDRFVCVVHPWREAPNGEMVCRRCPAVADEYEDATDDPTREVAQKVADAMGGTVRETEHTYIIEPKDNAE